MSRDPAQSRGVRNNNPGNIRRVRGQRWLGQSSRQTDPEFVQFDSAVYGLRAIAVLLRTYYRRYHLHTVEEIIGRWAPPGENDTAAYVLTVAQQVGVAPNEPLDLDDHDVLRALIEAIVWVETGGYQYPPHLVDHAIALALADQSRPLRLRDAARTDTGRGSAVAAAATAAGSIATITSGLAELDWRVGVAVVIALAVAAVAAVWIWRSRRD